MGRRERLGFWFVLGVGLLKPPTVLLSRRISSGVHLVPPGGVVVAANHISLADPVVLCDFVLYDLERVPRFLAKRELFVGGGLVARVMRGAGQIPVDRDHPTAPQALDAAVAALRSGETVVIYPEGTVTRDPGKWPMLARTGRGAAGAAVRGARSSRWRSGARRTSSTPRAAAGSACGRGGRSASGSGRRSTCRGGPAASRPPRCCARPPTAVMDAITAELEVLRGERAPAHRVRPAPAAARGGPRDTRCRAGVGLVGDDVRQGARRRGHRRRAVGASAGARRGHPRHAREPRLPAGRRACRRG